MSCEWHYAMLCVPLILYSYKMLERLVCTLVFIFVSTPYQMRTVHESLTSPYHTLGAMWCNSTIDYNLWFHSVQSGGAIRWLSKHRFVYRPASSDPTSSTIPSVCCLISAMASASTSKEWLTESYMEQSTSVWPAEGRHILAQYDEDSVVVYQAYCPEIAEYAVKHQEWVC